MVKLAVEFVANLTEDRLDSDGTPVFNPDEVVKPSLEEIVTRTIEDLLISENIVVLVLDGLVKPPEVNSVGKVVEC